MVAGLGTGLFLFDQNGAPVNPLDNFAGRKGAGNIAPATIFDRRASRSTSTASSSPRASPTARTTTPGSTRLGADPARRRARPNLAGPLGATLIRASRTRRRASCSIRGSMPTGSRTATPRCYQVP
jgi:hypothetical protein